MNAGIGVLLAFALASQVVAQTGSIVRVSVSAAGSQANERSDNPVVSGDGRFVAYQSPATNLVAGDTRSYSDIFLWDRIDGSVRCLSVATSGALGNGDSIRPSISLDGRYIAFQSFADTIGGGYGDRHDDIFVRDRVLGVTHWISCSYLGGASDNHCIKPAISGNGSYVTFQSRATNLVQGDTNHTDDVFFRLRAGGVPQRISVTSQGAQGDYGGSYSDSPSAVSADGELVVFASRAPLAPGGASGAQHIYLRDVRRKLTTRVSVASTGQPVPECYWPSISANGRFVAFDTWAWTAVPDDTNDSYDVFVRDLLTGTTERVSLSSSGCQGSGDSISASMSADGRFVAFTSAAPDLVDNDTNGRSDVFVHDRLLRTTQRVSVDATGAQANGSSGNCQISADGVWVTFVSLASNLVPGDTNGFADVFLYQYGPDTGWPRASGRLVPKDYIGARPAAVRLEFRRPGEVVPFATWYAAVKADWSFESPSPNGIFDVSIKERYWLRRTVQADASSGRAELGDLPLVNGDLDGDNSLTLLDLARALTLFGTGDARGDVDGSGAVDTTDIGVIIAGFGASGDP